MSTLPTGARMIHTITGSNDFLRSQKLQSYIHAYKKEYGTHELEYIMATETELPTILQRIQSLPFLSPKKCIVIHDFSTHHSQLESIKAAFTEVPDNVDVLLYEPKLDKRTRFATYIKKATTYHDCKELDEPELVSWLTETAVEQGGSLDKKYAQELIKRVGVNQFQLYNELQKLLTYNPVIQSGAITELVDETPQSTSFALLDAAFTGNVTRALHILEEQRMQKVEPQMILGLIIGHVSTLAVLHEAPQSARPDDIAKAAKIHPYVVRKSLQSARSLSREQILSLVEMLRFIDKSYKRSAVDIHHALQFFIVWVSKQ